MSKEIVKLNYLRIAPRKVRLIGNLVKGLSVNEAEAQLFYDRHRAAKPLLKLLRSAMANIRTNHRKNPEDFYVENLTVDQGPMLKRSMPRARGMATPIQKKMSNIALYLAEKSGTTPRFKFAAAKKKKAVAAKDEARKSKKMAVEKETGVVKEKPGFFKKMFNSKARAAK